METSCTYVASLGWISDAVAFGSLSFALAGYGLLLHLQRRRHAAELAEDGNGPDPEASVAHA